MDKADAFHNISSARFHQLLKQYPDVVPGKLRDLDEKRYRTIPTRLREHGEEPLLLTKDQVATLVDWKLSHGKFRPSLRGLVQQNPAELVETTTGDAFAIYEGSQKTSADVKTAIGSLAKLRGIGPATASLLLSVYDEDHVPFFSDELFRWALFEAGKSHGWDRNIKYDVKEYLALFERVQSFRERFRNERDIVISSTDIEKVAYVLGKQSGSATVNSTTSTANDTKPSKKRKADLTLDSPAVNPGVPTKRAAKKPASADVPSRRLTRSAK